MSMVLLMETTGPGTAEDVYNVLLISNQLNTGSVEIVTADTFPYMSSKARNTDNFSIIEFCVDPDDIFDPAVPTETGIGAGSALASVAESDVELAMGVISKTPSVLSLIHAFR